MERVPRAPELPADRAFVVQFSAAADLGHHRPEGRVEHVVSGERARFHTLDELLGFMARLLGPARGAGETDHHTQWRRGR